MTEKWKLENETQRFVDEKWQLARDVLDGNVSVLDLLCEDEMAALLDAIIDVTNANSVDNKYSRIANLIVEAVKDRRDLLVEQFEPEVGQSA